ncbi:Hypothetical predicted protein [Octopus vulgaris]|uniref:Uncharacterized protein n=1 Tax=Octopus vulgaris TaxID=6645 RepID=A0AA36F1Z4_OCTVU|nr:Hypothetical predicted protein [Octopus vulgaris]
MTRPETELKNEFDLHCKTCKSIIIKKGLSVFRKFKFPDEALRGTHDKSSSKPSADFRKQVDPPIDITKFRNMKLIVDFEDWKPKEDNFDLETCIIEDLENYTNFIKSVKDCWMTKNMFDLENAAVEKLDKGKSGRGPVFCGNCYSKEEKTDPVEIIGWTNDSATLKPAQFQVCHTVYTKFKH